MPDITYKHTGIVLRNRGLATVSKRGGWHAGITDAGRHYLEHGRYPDGVRTARPKVRRPSYGTTPTVAGCSSTLV